MRTGPGQNYPASGSTGAATCRSRWSACIGDWRQIRDPDGDRRAGCWSRLLSDQRTAIVRGDAPRPLHEAPDAASPVRFRAEPGVVGRISRCAGGWCHLQVRGRGGFIRAEQLWGVEPGETIR